MLGRVAVGGTLDGDTVGRCGSYSSNGQYWGLDRLQTVSRGLGDVKCEASRRMSGARLTNGSLEVKVFGRRVGAMTCGGSCE